MSHRQRVLRPLTCLFAAALMCSLSAAPVVAQSGRQNPEEMSTEQLLSDFTHFVYIDQFELAEAYARAILERGLEPVELLGVIEDDPNMPQRFQQVIRRAMMVPELEPVAAELSEMYSRGRLDRARNPDEIARNIAMLDGNQRARLMARERLTFVGEYAAPQLLEVLLARSNPSLEVQVENLLVEMGGDAVIPLSEALLGVDESTQSLLARTLGRIGNSAALPYLYEVLRTNSSRTVRGEVERSILRIQQREVDPGISIAELYWGLGERYYRGSRSLVRFPNESHQLLWNYDPGIGLYPTPIRTEVFHIMRAMELAERALAGDPEHENAIGLWLAANFSREIHEPEGYANPVYSPDRRDALYYAVMSGAGHAQRVLERAIDDRDTPLARRAIEAVALTAGDASLWSGLGARRPLLEALSYPDRRVQYEAALALAQAKPVSQFPGAERVTPILAGAVPDASERFAVVLAVDIERQQDLRDLLMEEGYTVLQAGVALADVAEAIADAPGVDLLVADLPARASRVLLERVRETPRLEATPLLAMMPTEAWNELWPRYEENPMTEVSRTGLSDSQIAERVTRLVREAAGPVVSEAEARAYAVRSLDTLRDLAISRNPVLDVSDAAAPLISAIGDTTGEIQLKVADVLARINEQRAQVALMDAALRTQGMTTRTRIELMQRVAESAKSFGNMLESRHIREITRLAQTGAQEEATAAAALIGALNLPEIQLAPLILGDG
ncbi:MAG: hypothetical protein EA376_09670 [Phycisphaeraceae bacterium]|nr:MAG: hypothetical protein EA376_09670 [Phycisphaeraceae bacterium]